MRLGAWIQSLRSILPGKRVARFLDSDISLGVDQLAALVPFHIVLLNGCASRIGPALLKCLDRPDAEGAAVQSLLEITAPDDLAEVDWQQPDQLMDRPLELCSPAGLCFSAELQPLRADGWLLILHPIALSIRDLHRYGLTLQDLSLSDPLRQHVLPSLLNEGLQEMLLQEANPTKKELGAEAIERAWHDLGLES
jgi:hypothetical protein